MRIVSAALVFAISLPLAAQQPNPATLSVAERTQLAAAAEKAVTASGVPSASVSLVKNGEVVYDNAFGDARLDPRTPATPQMRYSIGSISKQFTAVALLQLEQQGKLSMGDPVSRWLPDLTRAKDITIRMVLSHTSGYQDFWPEDYVMTTMMQPATAQHILDGWAKKPLDFEPGTRWQYSNTNYVIAGRIAEIVSGQALFPYLQQHVFSPLQMQSVLDQDMRRLTTADALGYYRHALGPLRPAPEEGFGWMFAAGELALTAHDLSLWNIAVMNTDPRILDAKRWAELETPVLLTDGSDSLYALGLFAAHQNGHVVLFHSGEVSGFVAEQYIWPELKEAAVVLTNLDASGGAGDVVHAVAAIVFPDVARKQSAAASAAAASSEAKPAPATPVAARAEAAAQEDPATMQARNIFEGLQKGQLDRSLLTKLTSDYFTPEAIEDFKSSLAPLGKPLSFRQEESSLRGGMTFHVYAVKFTGGKSVEVTTYIEPDGKIEQYLVSAGS